jgi:SPP1 gp7 family putative phage head morphogenesis protein
MLQFDATSLPSSRFLSVRSARKEARERFLAGRKAETQYAIQMRKVAKQIGDIVNGMAPGGKVGNIATLVSTLNHYADLLKPWGEAVASRMIADVSRRDAAAWEAHGRMIGEALRREISSAPTGIAMRESLASQVQYITSLPREAAERIYKLTSEAMPSGTRAAEIAAEIMRSGEVSKSSAMRLARTGVSSTATALTKARAEFIGSPGYLWRTSRDGAVRPSHKAMEGVFVPWDNPPTIDGFTAHAGGFANCRCFPEVAIPDKFGGRRAAA